MSTLGHLIEETAGAICRAFIFWNIFVLFFFLIFVIMFSNFSILLLYFYSHIFFRFIHFKFLLFMFVSYVLKKVKRISDMHIFIFLKMYAFSESNISFCSKCQKILAQVRSDKITAQDWHVLVQGGFYNPQILVPTDREVELRRL